MPIILAQASERTLNEALGNTYTEARSREFFTAIFRVVAEKLKNYGYSEDELAYEGAYYGIVSLGRLPVEVTVTANWSDRLAETGTRKETANHLATALAIRVEHLLSEWTFKGKGNFTGWKVGAEVRFGDGSFVVSEPVEEQASE